ncbi:MAG: type III PLP-dependent enzyme domain-containing protein, partial [Planctomycetota bacterium]
MTSPLDLISQYGSPLYVYDLDRVRAQAQALRAAIPYHKLQLLYAIKANPCPSVVRTLLGEDFGIDAVSPGEVAQALRCGCTPEHVLYTENNATDDDLRACVERGVLVNCGSLDRLEAVARLGGSQAAVRINPDIGAAEHAHTLTAGPLTKFGIHHSQMDAVRQIEADTGIKVVGAHMHIGSNVLDAEAFINAMKVILSAAHEL